MDRTRRHVRGPIAGGVGSRRTGTRKRHLPLENDVGRLDRMGVIGIVGVRRVLPRIDAAEALLPQLLLQCVDVHSAQCIRGRIPVATEATER